MDFGSHLGSIFSHFAIILHTFFRHRFRIDFSLILGWILHRTILGDTYSTAWIMWFRHIQLFPNICFFYTCYVDFVIDFGMIFGWNSMDFHVFFDIDFSIGFWMHFWWKMVPNGSQRAPRVGPKSSSVKVPCARAPPVPPKAPPGHPKGVPRGAPGPILDGFGTNFQSILDTLPCPLLPSHPCKKTKEKHNMSNTPHTFSQGPFIAPKTRTFTGLRGSIPRQVKGGGKPPP